MWRNRLPIIRRLLQHLCKEDKLFANHSALALNCMYHDIMGNLTTRVDARIPLAFYEEVIQRTGGQPDDYMGKAAQLYTVEKHLDALQG